jgi:predicted MFS family arabinose efflux permease
VTPYRWIIFVLIVLGSLAYMYMWLSPAALITLIQSDLQIDIGKAGILITIIPLLNGIFVFGGSLVIDKLGLKWASALAMALLACGGGLSFFAQSYTMILCARLLVGIGAGLTSPTTGALTMAWFPAKEQPFINSLVAVLGYFGMTLAFFTAVPLANMLGSWQLALTAMASVPLFTAIAWLIVGRAAPKGAAVPVAPVSAGAEIPAVENGIIQAAQRREIWLIAIAATGQMWAFNTLTTFLPSWFETTYQLTKAEAANITGILPIAGIAGGLLSGLASGAIGLRKPFLWPMMAMMLIAALIVANTAPGPLVYICVGLCGLASSGWVAPALTVPMELKGATPQFVGGSMALIFGTAFIVSFFVSPLFGWTVPLIGMKTTLIIFSLPLLLSIGALLALPETGPRRKIKA